MEGTGRLDMSGRQRRIVDVTMKPSGRGPTVYLDRMTIDELQNRIPWGWLLNGNYRVTVSLHKILPETE